MAILFLVSAMPAIAFSEPNKIAEAACRQPLFCGEHNIEQENRSHGRARVRFMQFDKNRNPPACPPVLPRLLFNVYSSSLEKMSEKLAGKSRWFGECKDAIRELENRGNT